MIPEIPSSTNANSAGTAGDNIADAANQAWTTTRDKAGEVLQNGERYVRDHPGTSALSIFGVGFLVGVLVGWSIAQEDENEYSANARKFAKRWGKKMNWD